MEPERMWRHQEPDFALHLLCELQKQQQCSRHCDILLQTDGISVPAHSCVLSAVSPFFSRALASSPSLPPGQSRPVSLQMVRARALLKLVGFMYSGEIQGEDLEEQREVFDLAGVLGLTFLTDGRKNLSSGRREKVMTPRRIGSLGADGPEAGGGSAAVPDPTNAVRGGSDRFSPAAGPEHVNNIVSSPSHIGEASVRARSKRQPVRPEKNHMTVPDVGGTQISLKIKLKRQTRGALWEIVSVQEENANNGPKACSPDSKRCGADPKMTNIYTERSSLHGESTTPAQTHRTGPEMHLSPSPTFTGQNLGTVTLTPPSDPAPSSPAPSERSCLHTPHPVVSPPPLHLSPDLAPPEETEEQITKLLEDMDVMGLSILPSVSMERMSDVCSHLDQGMDEGFDRPAFDGSSSSSTHGVPFGLEVPLQKESFDISTSEEHSGRISVSTVQDDLQGEGCSSEETRHLQETSQDQVPHPAGPDHFSDMRIPSCLSPLFSEESLNPPDAQTHSSTAGPNSASDIPLCPNQTAHMLLSRSSVEGNRPLNSIFKKDDAKLKQIERRTDEPGVRGESRSHVDDTVQKKRPKMMQTESIRNQKDLPCALNAAASRFRRVEHDVYRENEQRDQKRRHGTPCDFNRPPGCVQTSRKLKDSRGSCVRIFTAGHNSIQNNKRDLDLSEGTEAKGTKANTSAPSEDAVKPFGISPAKKLNFLDKIFHQTGFNDRSRLVLPKLNPKTAETKSLTYRRSGGCTEWGHVVNKTVGVANNGNKDRDVANKSDTQGNDSGSVEKCQSKQTFTVKGAPQSQSGPETDSSGRLSPELDTEFTSHVSPTALGTDLNNNIQENGSFTSQAHDILTLHQNPKTIDGISKMEVPSVRTERLHIRGTTPVQTARPGPWTEDGGAEAGRDVDVREGRRCDVETSDVEVDVMDQRNQVHAGKRDEGAGAGRTADDEDEGRDLTCEGELKVLPSNEARTLMHSPLPMSQSDVSQEDSGLADLSRSSLTVSGSSAELNLEENEHQAGDGGSEDEDVDVDVLDVPDVPLFIVAGIQADKDEDDDEVEEEEEVDVLM